MIRALIILIVLSVLISCIITPPIYSALTLLFAAPPWPYSRVFDRVILLVAIILIWFLRKELNLKSVEPFFNAASKRSAAAFITTGVLISFGTAMLFASLLVGDKITWQLKEPAYYYSRLLKLVPAAFIIALIEESFFRALLYQKIKEISSLIPALLISSFIYAVVHFLTPDKSFTYSGYSLFVGFEYLGVVLKRLTLAGVPQGIIGLMLVGIVLCVALERTKNIYFSIGLHAGWIMAVKGIYYFTATVPGAVFLSGPGRRYYLVTEPLGWLSVAVVFLIVLLVTSDSFKWSAKKACT
ncbi:MAG: CPBP family intramembrane metalloprotease [Candidatus Dadabacteria bacterium]|nr:MAG: CPBP family intramembrane metalloprotease [Candidatus Dadabacteria bacterium]